MVKTPTIECENRKSFEKSFAVVAKKEAKCIAKQLMMKEGCINMNTIEKYAKIIESGWEVKVKLAPTEGNIH